MQVIEVPVLCRNCLYRNSSSLGLVWFQSAGNNIGRTAVCAHADLYQPLILYNLAVLYIQALLSSSGNTVRGSSRGPDLLSLYRESTGLHVFLGHLVLLLVSRPTFTAWWSLYCMLSIVGVVPLCLFLCSLALYLSCMGHLDCYKNYNVYMCIKTMTAETPSCTKTNRDKLSEK